MEGEEYFPFMRDAAEALSKAMPHAELRTLDGQAHQVSPGRARRGP